MVNVNELGAGRLLERERELALAREQLSQLVAGRGQLLVVEAAAGLGKTALLGEIGRQAAAMGVQVLSARGSALERDFAFGIVRQWLDQVRLQGAGNLERVLSGPARAVTGLIDPGHGTGAAIEGDAFAVLHGLYWALANLCAEQPVLLVLDDVHWADAASLRFAAFMQPRVPELALMLTVGTRPSEAGRHSDLILELSADPAALVLRPQPLSVQSVAGLAARDLGTVVAPEFAAACHAATAGNPFYLQTLFSELLGRQIRPEAANSSLVHGIGPRNVSRAVLLQLAHLPRGTAALAQALAVLGDEADQEVLAGVASIDKSVVAAGLDALRQASVLVPGELRPRFVHPIVRAAVYEDMGVSQRAEAHAHAAAVLYRHGATVEAIAGQLLRAPASGVPWAVETLGTAGGQALARGAPEAAITYFQRALAEPLAPAVQAEMLARLGGAEAQLMAPSAVEHLQAALETGSDIRWQVRTARALARTLGFRSRVPEAIAVLERAAEELDGLDPELSLALINEVIYYGRVDREGRRLTRDRATRLCQEFAGGDRANTPAERLAFLNAAAEITMRGDSAAKGAGLAEEALRDAVLIAEETVASPIPPAAVLTLVYCDHLDRALAVVDDAIAQSVRSGSILGFAHYSLLRAEVNLGLGALEEAEADARASLGSVRVPGVVAQQVGVLLRILVERGQLAGAQRALEQHRLEGELRDAFHVKELLERRGRLRLVQGRYQEALDDLLEAGERQLSFDMPNPATLAWRSQAAMALHHLGRDGEARNLALEEVRLARRFGARRAVGTALIAAGLVQSEQTDELLAEAVAVLDGSAARVELSRALIVRGGWLRRRGKRVAARPLLLRGLELARECGAEPLIAQASDQLASAGARPRSELRTGRAALTPTELRVARLAAEGLSNPEIAQAQFVTLKTVETQLGSCYRKLGIGSRRELERALQPGP
jgi:DNA-binding CsgD family transcriptional regulator